MAGPVQIRIISGWCATTTIRTTGRGDAELVLGGTELAAKRWANLSIRPRFRPQNVLLFSYVVEKIGRSGEIRTPDPLLPKQVLCRANALVFKTNSSCTPQ